MIGAQQRTYRGTQNRIVAGAIVVSAAGKPWLSTVVSIDEPAPGGAASHVAALGPVCQWSTENVAEAMLLLVRVAPWN